MEISHLSVPWSQPVRNNAASFFIHNVLRLHGYAHEDKRVCEQSEWTYWFGELSRIFTGRPLYRVRSSDKTIMMWRTDTGENAYTLKGHVWSMKSVAFSPDGLYILIGSSDNIVRLLYVEMGNIVRMYGKHK